MVRRWLAIASLLFRRQVGPQGARRRIFSSVKTRATEGEKRQLLVDVSTIMRHDAGTGIQRVVRAIMAEFRREPPPQFDVRPVYASRWHGYRYADSYPARSGSSRVSTKARDVFVALDFTPSILPRHRFQLAQWKAAGAHIYFVVHDMLPILHPEWFTARASRNYRRWIWCLAVLADGALCTTRTGARELRNWLDQQWPGLVPAPTIESFVLGGDMEASDPSRGVPGDFPEQLARLRNRINVLVVGTIEPRKAHSDVLQAFEALWSAGTDVNLVLVGRRGWRSKAIIAKLRHHGEAGKRLHWFDDASDEALAQLYDLADGVLVASYAEGFGLPIVEAAAHGKSLLLRDTAVFREVAGEHAEFFSAKTTGELSSALAAWIARLHDGSAISSGGLQRVTWRDGAGSLTSLLIRNS